MSASELKHVSAPVIEAICRKYKIREIAVFGSAARGEARADSDIEVYVEFEPGLPSEAASLGDLSIIRVL